MPNTTTLRIGTFDKKLMEMEAQAKSGTFPWGSVSIDGGNLLYHVGLTGLVGPGKRPHLPDYGQAHERFKNTLRRFRELPCVTYITFHEEAMKDEITGTTRGQDTSGRSDVAG